MMFPVTVGEAHTYQIRDNAVKYIGSGELYDSSYSQYERSTTLPGNQLVDPETGIQYAVYFYPSDEMFSRYYSRTPIYACIGAVLLVVITGWLHGDYPMMMHVCQSFLYHTYDTTYLSISMCNSSGLCRLRLLHEGREATSRRHPRR